MQIFFFLWPRIDHLEVKGPTSEGGEIILTWTRIRIKEEKSDPDSYRINNTGRQYTYVQTRPLKNDWLTKRLSATEATCIKFSPTFLSRLLLLHLLLLELLHDKLLDLAGDGGGEAVHKLHIAGYLEVG